MCEIYGIPQTLSSLNTLNGNHAADRTLTKCQISAAATLNAAPGFQLRNTAEQRITNKINMRTFIVVTKAQYSALQDKNSDTIYYD